MSIDHRGPGGGVPIMDIVEQRLLALDRVWDLVTNSEAADQDTIAVADIRAAITTWREPS